MSQRSSIKALQTNFFDYQFEIEWELTERCNYSCSYCASYNNNVPTYFKSIEEYKKAVMYVKNYIGNKRAKVNFLGGEPTLNKNWVQLVNFLDEQNFVPRLTTNLSIDPKKYIDKLESKFPFIITSFHPEFTEPSHFTERVKLLNDNNLLHSVSIMADTKNWVAVRAVYDNLKDVVEDCPIVKITDEHSSDTAISSGYINYSDEQLKLIEESLSESKTDYEIIVDGKAHTVDTLRQQTDLNFKGMMCAVGKDRLHIKPNGDVYPSACFLNYPQTRMGNIYKENLRKVKKEVKCRFTHCYCGPDIRIEKWAQL